MKKQLLFAASLVLGSLLSANAQFIVFDDAIVPTGTTMSNAGSGSLATIEATSEAFSGTSAIKIFFGGYPGNATANWAMTNIVSNPTIDMSDYANGSLSFKMKTTTTNSFNIRITDGVNKPKIDFVSGNDPYGFVRDGAWHEVVIPVANFKTLVPALNLASISEFFVFRSGTAAGSGWDAAAEAIIWVDDIKFNIATGVKAPETNKIGVYPNPASNVLTLQGVEGAFQASIVSLTGQLVKQINQTNNNIDVADLNKGVYMVTVVTYKGTSIAKFTKK